jgi:lipopolysaccharide/colanic/teichoic acid biosynthesis glycosyltransferase
MSKRLFDLVMSCLLLFVLWPVLLIVAIAVAVFDGRPVLYVSERMNGPKSSFGLIKFRTMAPSKENSGVSGGDKAARVSRLGRFLRRTRLDELPQLWNIIRGELSIVGPRPPLRQYVEAFPELYGRVLHIKPGVTGLASVFFHKHEEKLIASCKTAQETDDVYKRRCVPRKARMDLMYSTKRYSVCRDMFVIFSTLRKLVAR